jgi:hypothetical protein
MVKAIDQALTLVPVIKPKAINPVTQRRNRLLKAIRKQQAALEQYKLGEKTDRVWFWSSEEGKLYLHIKYGKVVLELAKGKFAIQCNTLDDVARNLGLVENLINKGEFDQVLTQVSRDIRARFGKQT